MVLFSKEYLVCDTGCSAWSVLLHDQMHRRSTLPAFMLGSLELLGGAGTMLSNETAPLLLQKSETDESPRSAVLKHAFIGGNMGTEVY